MLDAGIFSFGTLIKPTQFLEDRASTHQNVQTVNLLQPALNLDPNPAKGGAEIVVVDNTALAAQVGVSGKITIPSKKKVNPDQISVYTVREGDTLSQIANMFEVSVNTIKWANDLKGAISPAQKLVILPITGMEYTIKKGDTIASIAKKYKADEVEIRQFNGLSDSELVVGDEIIIPNAEPKVKAAPKKAAPSRSYTAPQRSSTPVYSGYYMRPIVGGYRTQGIHGYNAVDLAASVGTPIYAAASGQVIIARSGGWNGGYGNYVVIKHDNGTQTLYSHNSSNAVVVGQWVAQGQVIGYVGSTGRSTGPHVHFEIRGAYNPF